MDEHLIIEVEGRAVGVAVRVSGGFMFFSSDPDLKAVEATVFPRSELVTRRVAEIVRAKKLTAIEPPPSWSTSATDVGGDNVVRLRIRQWQTNQDPGPPDVA